MGEVSSDIAQLVAVAVRDALAAGVVKVAALPVMYKFPEDIAVILGGHVPVGTIRSWKTCGYLRTNKVGVRSYVTAENWQWFLDNHGELMAQDSSRRFVANA